MGLCLEKVEDNNVFKYPSLSTVDMLQIHFGHPYDSMNIYLARLVENNVIKVKIENTYTHDIDQKINLYKLLKKLNQDDINEILLEYEINKISGCLFIIALWYVLVYLGTKCSYNDINVEFVKVNECNVVYLKKYKMNILLEKHYPEY